MVRRVLCLSVLASALLCLPVIALAAPGMQTLPDAADDDGMLFGHDQDIQKNTHGIGVSAAVYPLLGFAYRHYFGNVAVQVHVLPLLANRGDYLSLHFGAEFIDYMLVWTRAHGSLGAAAMPATALRLVGSAGVSMTRDQSTNITVPDANCGATCQASLQGNHGRIDYLTSVGAGFGFEFGAIMRPGFSLAVDLMMTALWDNEGFYAAYPLPYGTLMYNW
jgi:hypothetical protein